MGIEELQKEWRDMVINKLNDLERGQSEIKKEITDIKLNTTPPNVILDQETRIRTLESFKERAIMLFFVIQFIIGIGIILLEHYWK